MKYDLDGHFTGGSLIAEAWPHGADTNGPPTMVFYAPRDNVLVATIKDQKDKSTHVAAFAEMTIPAAEPRSCEILLLIYTIAHRYGCDVIHTLDEFRGRYDDKLPMRWRLRYPS